MKKLKIEVEIITLNQALDIAFKGFQINTNGINEEELQMRLERYAYLYDRLLDINKKLLEIKEWLKKVLS